MAQIDTTGSDFLLGRNTSGNPASGLAGTLTGTMGQPPQPGASNPAPPAPPVPQAGSSTSGSDTALANALTSMQSKFNSNNALMAQRNTILKGLYNQPLTPEELNTLDPAIKEAYMTGDRNRIDMSLRLISDEIQGRNSTLDQSMKFLVSSYQQEQDKLEQQKQNSIKTVESFVQTYGKNANSALKALYGQDYIDHLKTLGIDVGAFANVPIPVTSGPSTKPSTATEIQNAGYYDRTVSANQTIDNLGAKFTGLLSYFGQWEPNFMKSSDRQQLEQAERNFVNAVLRRESGAAISQSEFDSAAKQYFPQPGDSPEVLAQKSQNRAAVVKNLGLQSGNAATNTTGTKDNDPLGIR